MAITNQERVGKAMELLRDGLRPFVERVMKAQFGERWSQVVAEVLTDSRLGKGKGEATSDVAVLLVLMDRKWSEVFRLVLGKAERSLVNELLETRKRWAHQEDFSNDDVYRALDSVERLLTAVSAPQAAVARESRLELRRVVEEQARDEERRNAGTAIEGSAPSGLTPGRHTTSPNEVACGKYEPLHQYLKTLTEQSAVMKFSEIEAKLGFGLPRSARQYREWWSNEAPERTRHRHSRAWTLAGRMATPDLKTEMVRFDKASH